MNGVKVVTDSVSDVPEAVLSELGVDMVPVTVRFGQEEFRDRVELGFEEFMRRLVASKEPARTSQPSPGEFADVYRRAGADGRPVVSIQPSVKLSGTYQSACIARDIVAQEGYRVEVIDTRGASMVQGWAVIEAARAALAGLPVEKVVERAKEVAYKAKIFLTVDTLAYLQRNGRLGKVQALVGSLLQLKPIITLRDGELAPADVALGAEKVLGHLVGNFRRTVREKAKVALAVVHAAARDRAEALRRELEKIYNVVELVITETGPAIAANTGPGAYGGMLYEVDR